MPTTIKGSLVVVYQPVSTLVSYPHNARAHSNHQIRQIARSITEFGFTNPILIDKNNTIIAGHGRLLAAQFLGLEQVPTIRLGALTESQIRAYVLADNQLALNAGWDKSILAIELGHLMTINEEIDITVTGFEIPEIDLILQDASNSIDPHDELPIEQMGPAVTQPGDVWQLGKHRVLCGNSLQENSYKTLLRGKRAAIIVSDPPYNVRIYGNVCGNGAERIHIASQDAYYQQHPEDRPRYTRKGTHRIEYPLFGEVSANETNLTACAKTLHATLTQLKQFFFWLADQPGYKARLRYSDADYFNLSEKDTRIATARREKKAPTPEQIKHAIQTMPNGTEIEQRNRALMAFTLLTGARDSAIASMKLKHADMVEGYVYQDAREVKTKFGKTFVTYFFPVGDEIGRLWRSGYAF